MERRVTRPVRVGYPSLTMPGVWEIPLTQGKVALVDAEDLFRVSLWSWSAHRSRQGRYYARANVGREDGSRWYAVMHAYLLRPPTGMEVDHRNGNGLDNRRCNLRLATHKNNMRNMRRHGSESSGFKGVSWFKRDSRWRAYVVVDGRQRHLGYFDDEAEAARAYDAAAKELFGEFASLNFAGGEAVAS